MDDTHAERKFLAVRKQIEQCCASFVISIPPHIGIDYLGDGGGEVFVRAEEIDKAHAIIYWSIDPTGVQQLVGITMGMLDADTPMKANVNAQPAPVQTIDSQTAASDANDSAIKGVNDKQNGSSLAGGSQPSKKATEPGTPAE